MCNEHRISVCIQSVLCCLAVPDAKPDIPEVIRPAVELLSTGRGHAVPTMSRHSLFCQVHRLPSGCRSSCLRHANLTWFGVHRADRRAERLQRMYQPRENDESP